MVLIGAKGHAKEVLDIISQQKPVRELYFFDNVSEEKEWELLNQPLITNFEDLEKVFKLDNDFILALGGTNVRLNLTTKIISFGGKLNSIVANNSFVSKNSKIGKGVNILAFSSIFGNTVLGEGVLVNSYASVHHDSQIGDYVELSPGCRVLGNCEVGTMTSIGANAVILPGISVCENTVIGAGSVVTKNISSPGTYLGIPAKRIK